MPTGKAIRRDLSAGSQRMADGGNDSHDGKILGTERQRLNARMAKADERVTLKVAKENLIRKFRRWKIDGALGSTVRCPLCKTVIETRHFENHVRKFH